MPTSNPTCPICNENVEAGQTSCPRCGFKLVGTTQSFNPVASQPMPQPASEGVGTPALEVVSGPYAGERFVLGEGTYTIGRDPKCDIFLSNMTVSRHNATLVIGADSAWIEDAGSTNGTWVNGYIVDRAELEPGTHVQIGTFDMVFRRD